MTSTVRFNVDDLVKIPAEHIAVVEILKGTFDDEIARVTALRDELKARQEVDQTLEKATAALADAEAKQAAADNALANAKEKASLLTEQAHTLMAQATAANQAAIEEGAKVVTARTIFEAEKKNAQELMDQRSAALDLRESQLAATASKIGEEQRQLAVDREAFNRRLEALKA